MHMYSLVPRPSRGGREGLVRTVHSGNSVLRTDNSVFNPFNSNFNFMPCRLHPASNGNAISESHPENEGHAHITSLRNYNYVIPRTKWRLERSTAPYSSYTAAPRRTAPGPSNLCPSYLTTLVTIHSSYGCLVKKKKK